MSLFREKSNFKTLKMLWFIVVQFSLKSRIVWGDFCTTFGACTIALLAVRKCCFQKFFCGVN